MIQKDALGDYFKCSKMNRTETFETIIVALTVFFLTSIPTLIRYFHLTQAQTLLLDNIGHHIVRGLAALDALTFTNTVVTFLFWGFVGIIIYAFTMALVRFWQVSQEDKELASDEYVHPTGFSKWRYWQRILEKEAFSIITLTAELIVVSAVLFWALPFGLQYFGEVLQNFSVLQLLLLVLWMAAISGLFCFGRLIARAWRYRHILFEQ